MKISKNYTNFVSIPLIRNHQGRLFTDPLWAKDILLHLNYIDNFNLCCPIVQSDEVSNLEDITDFKINNIFPLNKDYGFLSVIKNIIPNFLSVVKACKNSDIVHSGGAGWAFPLSFYILPLKPILKFQWIIIIESSFWLMSANEKPTLRKVISHYAHKYLLTLSLKIAEARIFTQTFYKQLFLDGSTKNTLINAASWIDESSLTSFDLLKNRIQDKKGDKLKFLFPARLIEDKGVKLLFNTIKILASKNVSADIAIIGEGDLKSEVIAFANKNYGNINVNYLDQVEYGPSFFKLIQEYDAVLVPNIKEEQPRIIFDAFSQGVGVICSNTTGIMDIVTADKNAYIFNVGDSYEFAEAIVRAIKNPKETHNLGAEGLKHARGKTHANMHKDRLSFLCKVLKL